MKNCESFKPEEKKQTKNKQTSHIDNTRLCIAMHLPGNSIVMSIQHIYYEHKG